MKKQPTAATDRSLEDEDSSSRYLYVSSFSSPPPPRYLDYRASRPPSSREKIRNVPPYDYLAKFFMDRDIIIYLNTSLSLSCFSTLPATFSVPFVNKSSFINRDAVSSFFPHDLPS